MMVFVNMLYHRVDMFIDRHPDQLMLCSLYLVCSKMKLAPTVDFQKIKDAYMEMNESFYNSSTLNTIFYEVKLTSSNNESGNIVSFYNKVFAPNVRPFWKSFIGE
jgi:glutathionyl-hydroquinone reductase